jgi:GAF domain-containing protein
MIVLVSPTDTLITRLTHWVAPMPFAWVESLKDVETHLHPIKEGLLFGLIIFDATHFTTSEKLNQLSQKLEKYPKLKHLPILALITRLEQRQWVLEAGLDDYLLLPLTPTELKTKLTGHLYTTFQALNLLNPAIMRLRTATKTVFNRPLKILAQIFQAHAAWLLLAEPNQSLIQLVGSYHLPALLAEDELALQNEINQSLLLPLKNGLTPPQLISKPYVAAEGVKLTHRWVLPFYYHEQPIGLLTFAYTTAPPLSRPIWRFITQLWEDLAYILEMYYLHYETQNHATQTAFMVLLSRMINENLELNAILSLTLEQAVALLDASGGGIWLLAENEITLNVVSFLSDSFHRPHLVTQHKGKGLIGSVAQNGQILHTTNPTQETHFQLELDQIEGLTTYSLLAMPLRHHQNIIGVLALYQKKQRPFTHREITLMQGIANLAASAISNAKMMAALWHDSQQRQALYEMSQEIAQGLDLQVTLERTLEWTTHMTECDLGLLWLTDNQSGFYLAATKGKGLTITKEKLTLDQSFMGGVVQHQKALIINDPTHDPHYAPSLNQLFTILIHNLLVIPLVYEGKTTGVLTLLNKKSSLFNEADATLMSTAVEIVAVSVENAKLYQQTVKLHQEKEKLNQQALQGERLATVGRLTATLSHEINNPMQAIRGALSLALEDLDDRAELEIYLNLCLVESDRIVKLVNQMRQIYRPHNDTAEKVDINHLITEASSIAYKELNRQHVNLELKLAPQLPHILAIAHQLQLVFLNTLLNIGQAINKVSRGKLEVRSYSTAEALWVDFATDVAIFNEGDWTNLFKKNALQSSSDLGLGLSLNHDIIIKYNGEVSFRHTDKLNIFTIKLPLTNESISYPHC